MQLESPPLPQQKMKAAKITLTPYRESKLSSSLWQLATTLAMFVACWVAMWLSLSVSYALTLLLAIPTGSLVVRLFVLQHDCGHGSFFKSKRVNNVIGSLLGILTLTPYHRWRKRHAIHHATSGDLDRRGYGDVTLLTVKEYQALPFRRRLLYRIERHPLVLFGIGAFAYFAIWQRFTFEPKTWTRERSSVHFTNLGVLITCLTLCWLIGWQAFFMVHLPVVAVASSIGVWLFFIQHHYEDAYWQRRDRWEYYDASLEGCSYYELPRPLQWLTANIGLHHIHHLDSHIPNYRLQACFEENPALQVVTRLSIRESLACATLMLWDEDRQIMVPFPKWSRL